ncbi:MAG: PD40 domain-containing protein [Acidobacteria bacterium]|nr:PD40 domain-containing protein [Acidobacteriota bacterium]
MKLWAWMLAASSFAPWTAGVKVGPVTPGAQRHSIHSYFNTSPESPDGRWVLFYTSKTAEGHAGEVRIRERATGVEKVLASGVTTEDAHRAACQQWVSKGRTVVFHDLRDGHWVVVAVDVASARQRVIARDRMVGWGTPDGDVAPVYGPHWDAKALRDLELVNVRDGSVRTPVTAAAVRAKYGEQVAARFGDRGISIFFPILSPDAKKVVFKLATPSGGDFRSKAASDRETLLGYDLAAGKFLFFREKWGHPAWHPDSRRMINVPNLLVDAETGTERGIPGLPVFPGSHPSISPDGKLFASDTTLERFGGTKQEWGVVVGDLEGTRYRILHRFRNDQGAKSWRVSHPHPVFSPDSRRIYFNVSAGEWTELHVAELD